MSSSEAKTLAPSDKKLREARRKGQVAQFRDIGSVAVLATGCAFLWVALPRLVGIAEGALEAAFAGIADDPAERAAPLAAVLLADLSQVLGLFFGFLVGAAVLASVAVHGGLMVSLDPISPKMSNLDPVKGFGRIFGVRALVEFAKSLLRLALGVAAVVLIGRYGVPSLIRSPACGLGCLLGSLGTILAMLFAAFVALGLVFAVPDLRLQRWLFERQMKMTRSEQKREHKDTQGTPEVRGEQRRLRREIAATATRLGGRNATLVVFGDGVAVGLRYVKAEVGVPMVVARARGSEAADRLLDLALLHGVPLWRDGRLALAILEGARLAQPIPQAEFQPIAEAMAQLAAAG